jgi:hypothetical protein
VAWDQEFAKDLQSGSASIRKAPITNGNSILKFQNSEQKGVERHTVFTRDKQVTTEATSQEQISVILTNAADDPASQARLVALANGVMDYLQTEGLLTRLVAGEM